MALDNFEDFNGFVTASLIADASISAIQIEQYINQLRIAGATDDTIWALLLADLEDGGRLFGSYASSVTGTVKSSVDILGNISSMDVYREAGINQFKWVVVNGANACPDCNRRQGRVENINLWNAIGTPASGGSVCRQHCDCKLEPIQYNGKTSFDKPKK